MALAAAREKKKKKEEGEVEVDEVEVEIEEEKGPPEENALFSLRFFSFVCQSPTARSSRTSSPSLSRARLRAALDPSRLAQNSRGNRRGRFEWGAGATRENRPTKQQNDQTKQHGIAFGKHHDRGGEVGFLLRMTSSVPESSTSDVVCALLRLAFLSMRAK